MSNWVKNRPRYRCRFPKEYAGVQEIDHPLSVYLREDHVVPHLNGWLAQVFSPAKVAATLERIAEVQDRVEAELGPLRQRIAECDRKLTQHKRAIEAGVDPTIVNGWMQDIVTDRSRLQHELAVKQRAARRPLSTQQIKELADSVGGLTAALEAAEPADKNELYRLLGLNVRFDKHANLVEAHADPSPGLGVLVVSEARVELSAHPLYRQVCFEAGA
ncbi:hypothetical protein [Actinokineospora sp. NPDC004072]